MTTSSIDRAPAIGTWVAFCALCVGMFMAVLDVQVVAASLPTIRAALNIPAEQMSSIQTGYLIAEVVAIPLTGLFTRALGCDGWRCFRWRHSFWPRSAAP
jgi:DHA2 family multidrug resistance protein